MIIGIDPGLNHPALACIDDLGNLKRSIRIDPRQKEQLITRYRQLNNEMRDVLDIIENTVEPCTNFYFIIEMPQFFNTSKGSKTAERQDLSKLCTAFGIILANVLRITPETNVKLITPIEWKGNLPKRITRKRMETIYGDLSDSSDDEVDALALARYAYDNKLFSQ